MSEKKMTSIGGQAVIEGVMMRGPHKIAVAVRKPDGEIVIDEKPSPKMGKIAKFPIIRGVYAFFSSLVIGVQALTFSAKFFADEEEKKKAEQKKNKKEKKDKNSKKEAKKENENGLSDGAIYFAVVLSLLLSVGMFIVLPNLVTEFVVPNQEAHPVLYNFIEISSTKKYFCITTNYLIFRHIFYIMDLNNFYFDLYYLFYNYQNLLNILF